MKVKLPVSSIQPDGKPNVRLLPFAGFIQFKCYKDKKMENQMNKDPNKTDRTNIPFIILDDMYLPAKNKLLNSLLFKVDIRSDFLSNILKGSKFTEICWFFPYTKEQYRLSGTFHTIISPTTSGRNYVPIGKPFCNTNSFDIDWEQLRKMVWNQMSDQEKRNYLNYRSDNSKMLDPYKRGYKESTYEYDYICAASDSFDNEQKNSVLRKNSNVIVNKKTRMKNNYEINKNSESGEKNKVYNIPLQYSKTNQSVIINEKSNFDNINNSNRRPSPILQQKNIYNFEEKNGNKSHYKENENKNEVKGRNVENLEKAYSNFCLLIVDIESIEYIEMIYFPQKQTTYYKIECPYFSTDNEDELQKKKEKYFYHNDNKYYKDKKSHQHYDNFNSIYPSMTSKNEALGYEPFKGSQIQNTSYIFDNNEPMIKISNNQTVYKKVYWIKKKN